MDVDVAAPGPAEVMIEYEAAGICHSDLNFLSGDFPHKFPVILGHEAIGTVVDVGESVTSVKAGDRVMPFVIPHCGECDYCRSGKTNFCVEFQRSFRNPDESPYSRDGQVIANFFGVGAFAKIGVVREDQVTKVHSAAMASPTCTLGCGVATGLGSVLKTANVQPGSSVVIFGAGGVGLSAIQGARIAGAQPIIVIDINPAKEALAKKLGATDFVNASTEDVIERVRLLTGGLGADYCFECVGSVALTRQAFACANIGWGEVVSVGMIPDSAELGIGLSVLRNRTWKRCLIGSATAADVSRYVEWSVSGKIDLEDVVSHTLRLEDINTGIELIHRGEATRVSLSYV